MIRTLIPQPLTQTAFAPFGDVLEAVGAPDKMINQAMCGRFHDRATLDFTDGAAGISIFDATPRHLPFTLDLMERHPDGSQAFVPMHQNPYLVVVAADNDGKPDRPCAFIAGAGQGVNYHRNVWHAVLCPLAAPGLFAVIDRIATGPNLEEYVFSQPWEVASTNA